MPERNRVEQFITAVVGGDPVQAIADYYHEDASMQENLEPPRLGRQQLIDYEANVLAGVQRMAAHPVSTFLIDGDDVMIRWTFDMTDRNGVTRRLEELALQRWRGDRIAQEQFFYDTAAAWKKVGDAGEHGQ